MRYKPGPEPRASRQGPRGAAAHPADGPPQDRAHLDTRDAAPWPRSLLQGGELDHGSMPHGSGRPERASRPAGGRPEKREDERCGGYGLAVKVHCVSVADGEGMLQLQLDVSA
jgi:hypothetical protein